MKTKLKKSNDHPKMDSTDLLIRERLREVRMGEYERIVAQAHLARAEAIAELLVRAAALAKKAVRGVLGRPLGRITAAPR
jgi:siroheme synthase